MPFGAMGVIAHHGKVFRRTGDVNNAVDVAVIVANCGSPAVLGSM